MGSKNMFGNINESVGFIIAHYAFQIPEVACNFFSLICVYNGLPLARNCKRPCWSPAHIYFICYLQSCKRLFLQECQDSLGPFHIDNESSDEADKGKWSNQGRKSLKKEKKKKNLDD